LQYAHFITDSIYLYHQYFMQKPCFQIIENMALYIVVFCVEKLLIISNILKLNNTNASIDKM